VTKKKMRAPSARKSPVTPRATASKAKAHSSARGRVSRSVAVMPRTVATTSQLCDMPRDNVSTPDYWMMTDGWRVTLARQRVGEPASEMATIPRNVFDAFADWYMTGTWRRPGKLRMRD